MCLTQTKFGAKFGVSFGTVNRWEAGTHEPTMKIKLFAVLTGNNIIDDDEDESDDYIKVDLQENEPEVELGTDLKLPPDYFKFIVVDECHRSIYGKWRSVLNYFNKAIVLGLTATPTERFVSLLLKNNEK